MATQVPAQQLNQSFSSGFPHHQRLHQQQPLKTPEKRSLRASFQGSSTLSSQKTTRLNHHNNNTPNNQQQPPTPILNNNKATTATPCTPTPNRHANHSRSKSYCGSVTHYGIGSTSEIIITSKSRLKNKLVVKEEPVRSSPSMLLIENDKENAVNANHLPSSPHSSTNLNTSLEIMPPSLPALAAVKKTWQLNSPQKNSTPTKKRSTSCLTPSTPLSISTSLTTIREPLTMALTPKSRARYEGVSGTHKFNAYSRINNIDAISLSISDDNEVWCGERKGIIAIFDTNTCKPVATIYEEKEKLYVSCMCPVGEFMWAGMADGSINIYNIKKRCLVKNLHGHIGTVTDIVYLGNDVIASCSVDFSIRLWDSSKFTPKVNCIGMRSLWVNTLCSVSGLLWSGSDDSLIRVWDTNTSATIKEITHSPQLSKNKSVESLDGSDSSSVSSFSSSSNETSDNSSKNSSKDITNAGVTQLSYCAKTNRVWSASRDCSVKIWNPTTFNCEHSINFPSYVNCMHIAGQYVWVATNKELSIWNVNDKSLVARFPVNGFVWCIKTVGDRVWIACSDKSIRVYNINETGVTQIEKRHFHGSKRLSSEFISLDVTSPLGQQPIMPLFPNNHLQEQVALAAEEEQSTKKVEEDVEETVSVKEINFNDYSPTRERTTQEPLNSVTTSSTFCAEDISIILQTEVFNIGEIKDDFSLQKEISKDAPTLHHTLIENISPVQNPREETFQHQLASSVGEQKSNSELILSPFTLSPVKFNQQTVKVEDTTTKFNLSLDNFTATIGTVNNNQVSSLVSHNKSLLGESTVLASYSPSAAFKEVRKSNSFVSHSHNHHQLDHQTAIELKECTSYLSTPSSEDCQSLSNGRLLFSDDVVDFEEPHYQSSKCSSVLSRVFGNALKCFWPKSTNK